MSNPRYLEQWNRVMRWHSRLQNFNSFNHSVNSEEPLDYTYAFFLNCFHLKNWLIKDYPERKSEIEALYDKKAGSIYLKICADIANANKHLKLNPMTARSNDSRISILTISVTHNFHIKNSNTPTPPEPGRRWNFWISFEGKDYDAYKVADGCIKKLENYLAKLD